MEGSHPYQVLWEAIGLEDNDLEVVEFRLLACGAAYLVRPVPHTFQYSCNIQSSDGSESGMGCIIIIVVRVAGFAVDTCDYICTLLVLVTWTSKKANLMRSEAWNTKNEELNGKCEG